MFRMADFLQSITSSEDSVWLSNQGNECMTDVATFVLCSL